MLHLKMLVSNWKVFFQRSVNLVVVNKFIHIYIEIQKITGGNNWQTTQFSLKILTKISSQLLLESSTG